MKRIEKGKVLSAVLLISLFVFVVFANFYLNKFSPLSGKFWVSAMASPKRIVNSPYGNAEVFYDQYGVPHILAENEEALYYATGYVHASDRLFQMDLSRRLMNGTLSEVFGEMGEGMTTVESDIFHMKMDFLRAAEASLEAIKDENPEVIRLLEAYSEGVNEYIRINTLPYEFQLLDYKPREWKPIDTLLIGKLISWRLTGDFWDLKKSIIEERLGKDAIQQLYPDKLPQSPTILEGFENSIQAKEMDPGVKRDLKEVFEYLDKFSAKPNFGSNNWLVSGEYTKTGKPMLANDPHLALIVPPIWYEMHQKTNGIDIRGVTFPGIPFVIIGQNQFVAWGFTNTCIDVLDVYIYQFSGEKYLYKGEWKKIDKEKRKLRIKTDSGFEEKEITIEKTVHGPLIEKEGKKIAIGWVGTTATREAVAIYLYNKAKNMAEFLEGMRYFDIPGQNALYIDIEGNTMYYPAGKYPIRRVKGEMVNGDRLFDGSEGEGEWIGFVPYGKTDWEAGGFIPFEEIPHRINPDIIGTANERITDETKYYLGTDGYFAEPFRSIRLNELLKRKAEQKNLDVQDFMEMQGDIYSKGAELFSLQISESLDKMDEETRSYAKKLEGWNFEMRKELIEPLIFSIWLDKYRSETFEDEFKPVGLDKEYYPKVWTLLKLPEDSPWFDDKNTEEVESRYDIIARAMKKAIQEIKEKEYKNYGEYNKLNAQHPFGSFLRFLNYPNIRMDGAGDTLFNFYKAHQTGSSWRMIATFCSLSKGIIPGGNSGNFFSKNYDDQLMMWARNEYKDMSFEIEGEKRFTFIRS